MKDLESRFGNLSSSRLYRLQERRPNTFQEPDIGIAEYFTKVKSLWKEMDDLRALLMCNCHPNTNFIKIQQDLRIMTFLMKLDPQYHHVIVRVKVNRINSHKYAFRSTHRTLNQTTSRTDGVLVIKK